MSDRPWTPGEAYAAVLGNAVALVLALLAWIGVSGKLLVTEQTGWVTLGIGAVMVAGAVNTVWLMAGRRALGLRRAAALDVALPAALAVAAAGGPALPADRADERPVAGAGMTAFHRPGCWLAAGRPVEAATVDTHHRAGRRACEVCGP